LTKTALADLIGKERQDIWAIEQGERNPTLQTIIQLAQAFEIPLSELMDFKIEKG
jgi:DNA-binding XRE family transcriptional regulator